MSTDYWFIKSRPEIKKEGMKQPLGLRFLSRTRMKQTRPSLSGLNAVQKGGGLQRNLRTRRFIPDLSG